MVTTVDPVTPTSVAPQRSQGDEDYSNTADAWAASITVTTTSWNASITQFNTAALEVNANAITASDAAASASANANFVGNWDDQVGAANVPTSVAHNGDSWQLLVDVADITLTEPGVDPEWQKVNSLSINFLSENLDSNGFAFEESAYRQIADASPATTTTFSFDMGAGDAVEVTGPSGGTLTLAITGFTAGVYQIFEFIAVNFGDISTLNIPAAWEFAGSAVPAFTSGGKDHVQLIKDKDEVVTLLIKAADVGAV